METLRQYASSPAFRAAVSRAQWAVVQTGLITSGLALFGVYVLATRINDMHLMNMYAGRRLPAGPLLVGLIAGSGYILAAWWFGVRVGVRLVATILLLQVAMFMACHYADFETRGLVLRETGEPVPFTTYFDYTTRRLDQGDIDLAREPSARHGYAMRTYEAACFAIGGVLAALTLVGRPTCALCGGLVRRRSLGRVGGPYRAETLKRLQERARLGDARGLLSDVAAQADIAANDPAGVELTLSRCEVCGAGHIEREDQRVGGAAAATKDPAWRIDAYGEFARQLFEHRPEPRPQPQTA